MPGLFDFLRPKKREEAPAQEQAQEAAPDWQRDLQGGTGNAQVIKTVIGQGVSEEEATSVLDEVPGTSDYAPEQSPEGLYGEVYQKHTERLQAGVRQTLSVKMREQVATFLRHFEKHKARYETVASQTNVPAKLIAAIHWRESTGNFSTYLHQGDPLGRPAVRVPKNIPIFHTWEPAAVHAINSKSFIAKNLGIDEQTTDAAALGAYAEFYNGLGYHKADRSSPYAYSGTDAYTTGKYVSDGRYSASARDRQLGVLPLLDATDGLNTDLGVEVDPAAPVRDGDYWQDVLNGFTVLKQGSHGPAVTALQERLAAAGIAVGHDGDYGRTTSKAVKDFQDAKDIPVTGKVDQLTAKVLDGKDPASVESPGWRSVLAGSLMLREGGRGDAVRDLQRKLKALGFLQGKVDGSFGAGTTAAVKAFQRSVGETPDGVVGAGTAGELR
ncbi:MAG: peptidoglycan-binding protein [Deltaproteobacteria bacterium]|nr:peptidoglycan-binding protein [Deltaproteobacteria bacterium]